MIDSVAHQHTDKATLQLLPQINVISNSTGTRSIHGLVCVQQTKGSSVFIVLMLLSITGLVWLALTFYLFEIQTGEEKSLVTHYCGSCVVTYLIT